MKKILFEDSNGYGIFEHVPAWRAEVIKRVNEEYQEAAVKASERVREKFMERIDNIGQGYFVTALYKIIDETPCYEYIKNISDGLGNEYTAEINLLTHKVTFIEV